MMWPKNITKLIQREYAAGHGQIYRGGRVYYEPGDMTRYEFTIRREDGQGRFRIESFGTNGIVYPPTVPYIICTPPYLSKYEDCYRIINIYNGGEYNYYTVLAVYEACVEYYKSMEV